MPVIRGLVSAEDSSTRSAISTIVETVLEFVCSEALESLAALGTSCPDHFLRTKIWPMVLPFEPARERRRAAARIPSALDGYRAAVRGLLPALQASQFTEDA